jgi:hypothetical protein
LAIRREPRHAPASVGTSASPTSSAEVHAWSPTTPAERQRLLLSGTWLNTSLADDLVAMLARDPAGIVVIDCMLAGVLARSAEFGPPTSVLVPGLYHSVLPVRDAMLEAGIRLIAQAGLPASLATTVRDVSPPGARSPA